MGIRFFYQRPLISGAVVFLICHLSFVEIQTYISEQSLRDCSEDIILEFIITYFG